LRYNPLLTDGERTKPLTEWKRWAADQGLVFEREGSAARILAAGSLRVHLELHSDTPPRREYMKRYRALHNEFTPGIKVGELAKIKFVSRITVYRNKEHFDVVPGSHPRLLKFNEKIFNWNPQKRSF